MSDQRMYNCIITDHISKAGNATASSLYTSIHPFVYFLSLNQLTTDREFLQVSRS